MLKFKLVLPTWVLDLLKAAQTLNRYQKLLKDFLGKIFPSKYEDIIFILLSCTGGFLFIQLFSHNSIEQFRTSKKSGKFFFGKCSKRVDFRSEVKGKELVSDILKNTGGKGIHLFQRI